MTLYDLFKKYAVPAQSVEDFLRRYYKEDRFRESLISSYVDEYRTNGYCFISRHDSRTGSLVAYY